MNEASKNLFDKNSDRILSRISQDEITQIKEAISLRLDELLSLNKDDFMRSVSSNRYGDCGNTIFHLIAKFGFQDQMLKLLNVVSYDQNFVDIKNSDDFTPLHFAAINGHTDIARELVKVGAQKDVQASEKKRRWTPVHYAAQYGHTEIVKILISSGLDKEIKTIFGLTPLHVAAEFGKLEVVEYLLSLNVGIDIKTVDSNHRMTALHYAVIGNFEDVVIALLNANANKDLKTILGYTAFDFAVQKELLEMVDILLRYGANGLENTMKTAQKNGNKAIIQSIKKYQKARAKIFSASYLKRNAKKIANILLQYNKDNIGEAKIVVNNASFNAFAVSSMSQKVKTGFFSRSHFDRSISEIATEFSILEICDAVHKLSKLGVIFSWS